MKALSVRKSNPGVLLLTIAESKISKRLMINFYQIITKSILLVCSHTILFLKIVNPCADKK